MADQVADEIFILATARKDCGMTWTTNHNKAAGESARKPDQNISFTVEYQYLNQAILRNILLKDHFPQNIEKLITINGCKSKYMVPKSNRILKLGEKTQRTSGNLPFHC